MLIRFSSGMLLMSFLMIKKTLKLEFQMPGITKANNKKKKDGPKQ